MPNKMTISIKGTTKGTTTKGTTTKGTTTKGTTTKGTGVDYFLEQNNPGTDD